MCALVADSACACAQGLVALVAVNLALNAGLITGKLFSMLVVMVLFNTFCTCPLLWLVYRVRCGPRVTPPPAPPSAMDAQVRAPFTVMIAPQSSHMARLLTVLGAACYPVVVPRDRRFFLLRLLPVSDRPSNYMGDFKGKALKYVFHSVFMCVCVLECVTACVCVRMSVRV